MSDGTSPAPKWAVRVKMWFVECYDLFARFAPGISSDKLSKTAISLSFAHQWLTSTNFVSELKRLTCSSCTAWKKVEIGMLWSALESPDGLFPTPPTFFFFFSILFRCSFWRCVVCVWFFFSFFILLAGGISLSYCCLFCALLLSFFLFFFLCLLSSISCFMEMILDYCWTRTPWNLWATFISKYRK